MAMATNNASGGGSKKAPIRVSQATIDSIKKMGMTKALAGAKSANPEMKEALTRMYGAARVAKAAGSAAPKYSASSPSQPKPKTAQYARGEKPVMSNAPKKTTPSAPAKRQSDFEKLVGGVKRVINSSPGANLGSRVSSKSLTPAQKAAAKKASAAAVKRAGGRTM